MTAPAGARVLVARSPDRAAELVTALRGVGAEPLLLPLIDFELASDQHSLDVAFDALGAGAYAWLVVSSVTTVQALEAKAAERGTTLSRWLPGSLLVATIGPATRRFLESRGVAVDLAPTGQQSGAGLIDIWPEHQGSVLLPQADIADPRLRRGLEARGAFVQAVTAYRTVDYPADPGRSLAACHPAAPRDTSAADTQRSGTTRPPCSRRTRRRPKSAPAGWTPSSPLPRAQPGASTRTSPRWAAAASSRSDVRPPPRRSRSASASPSTAEEPTASGLVAAVVRALASQPSPPIQPVAEPPAKDTI